MPNRKVAEAEKRVIKLQEKWALQYKNGTFPPECYLPPKPSPDGTLARLQELLEEWIVNSSPLPSSDGNLRTERLTETPANPTGIPSDVTSNCLRCGRKCNDYICERCSLIETEI